MKNQQNPNRRDDCSKMESAIASVVRRWLAREPQRDNERIEEESLMMWKQGVKGGSRGFRWAEWKGPVSISFASVQRLFQFDQEQSSSDPLRASRLQWV